MRACLEAGVIPDIYNGILTDAKVCEVKKYEADIADSEILSMSDGGMKAKAAEGYFIRDAERNLVCCPEDQLLRQKSIKRNGMIRYCNKLACQHCKNKCTASEHKEVDFSKDKLIITAKGYKPQNSSDDDPDSPKSSKYRKRKTIVRKVVKYVLHLDENKMKQRMCLSEHPFGTLKRSLGQYYFLLKGLKFTLKDTKEKQTLLYAVCYHESQRIKVSTGLKVVSETWNAKMQRCEISSRFTERVNRASRKVNKLLDAK